jgi:hypothetical protein
MKTIEKILFGQNIPQNHILSIISSETFKKSCSA